MTLNFRRYYVPTALQTTVGLSHNLSLLVGGFVQTMFFFGSLIPTFALDKMGRRRPMMWGSLGLAISMMMLSVLLSFHFKPDEYSKSLGKATASASVTFFFTYMLIFGATANCIPWVYVRQAADTITTLEALADLACAGPGNLAASRSSQGFSNWHISELALGTSGPKRCGML